MENLSSCRNHKTSIQALRNGPLARGPARSAFARIGQKAGTLPFDKPEMWFFLLIFMLTTAVARITDQQLRGLNQALFRIDRAAATLDSLTIALRKEPGNYLLQEQFLDACLLAGRPGLADTVFKQLKQDAQGGTFAWYLSGRLALVREDTTTALHQMARALHHGPLPLTWMLELTHLLQQRFGSRWQQHLLNLVPSRRRKSPAFRAEFRYLSRDDPDALKSPPAEAAMPWAWQWDWYRAYTLIQQGAFRQGVDLAQRRLRQASGQPVLQAYFHFLLGRSLVERDLPAADAHLDSALLLSSQQHLYRVLQQAFGWKGIVNLRYRFRYRQAVQFYRLARQLALKIGAIDYYFAWSGHLGEAFYQLDEYSRALEVLLEAENLARKKNLPQELIHFHWKKGDLFNYLGLYDFAEAEYLKARRLDRKVKNHLYQTFYEQGLADLAFRRRQHERAKRWFRQLLSRPHSLLQSAYWHIRLGLIARAQHRFDESEAAFRKAIQAADSAGFAQYQCWGRTHLGDLYQKQKAYRKAVDQYRKAWRWRSQVTEFILPISLLTSWAQAQLQLGLLDSAQRHLKQAIALIEQAGTTVGSETLEGEFFTLVGTAYNLLAATYLAKAQDGALPAVDSALIYLEASRARRLKRMLTRRPGPSGQSPRLRELERAMETWQLRLRQSICTGSPADTIQLLYSRVRTVQFQYLMEKMQYLQAGKALGEPWNSSISKRLNIPEGWTVLYYCLTPWRSYCLVMNPHGTRPVALKVCQDTLKQAVQRLRRLLRQMPEASRNVEPEAKTLAHRLYDWLMAPVQATAPLDEKVLVVPDPDIMGLPFELLLPKEGETVNWIEHSLQARHAFAYAPALRMPATGPPRHRSPDDRWLILANPFACTARSRLNSRALAPPYQTTFFQPLVGSEKEGLAIAKLHPHSQLFRRAQAGESLLEASDIPWRIIHIASHGFADPWFDEFSGLVLADEPSRHRDGYLMGYEILRQDFSAVQLVSLSACETGTGRIQTGEGLLGLPRLFLGAGAGSVLMTLWKVEDEFTARLMPLFYQYFIQSSHDPVIALASARRQMLRQSLASPDFARYRLPQFWAAFQLFVNPSRQFLRQSGTSPLPWYWLLALMLLAIIGLLFYQRLR